MQQLLDPDYSVCSYDRAGTGFSWSATYPNTKELVMNQMISALSQSGINVTDSFHNFICIGHGYGGQLCRYYAEQLPTIKAVVLLDSVPMKNFRYQLNPLRTYAEF
mmetsp:Transcript_32280/g.31573  ORF Transcript_32280/g.31573 Transcript_32280/m.31573 type:complete len:106 (+) Transcript_32280:755-1072(+)